MKAVLAVYAEENGEGIFFDAEEDDGADVETVQLQSIEGTMGDSNSNVQDILPPESGGKNKPFLKLVE